MHTWDAQRYPLNCKDIIQIRRREQVRWGSSSAATSPRLPAALRACDCAESRSHTDAWHPGSCVQHTEAKWQPRVPDSDVQRNSWFWWSAVRVFRKDTFYKHVEVTMEIQERKSPGCCGPARKNGLRDIRKADADNLFLLLICYSHTNWCSDSPQFNTAIFSSLIWWPPQCLNGITIVDFISVGKESACNAGDPGSISGSWRSAGDGIGYPLQYSWASLVAQLVKNAPAKQETCVRFLGWEDTLEKGKATHSSILSWRSPRTQSMGLQRVGHNWATFTLLRGDGLSREIL